MQAADLLAFVSSTEQKTYERTYTSTSTSITPKPGDGVKRDKKPWVGDSMYPKLLHELVSTVLTYEPFLFSKHEMDTLAALNGLPYEPRYLLVRLALRQRSKLHRISDIKARYSEELGDRVEAHLDILCATKETITQNGLNNPQNSKHLEDKNNDADSCPQDDRHREQLVSPLAEDESACSIEDLLSALKSDELKQLGQKLKVFKPKMTRSHLIEAMLKSSTKQATLPPSFFQKLVPRDRLREVTPPPEHNGPAIIDLVSPPPKSRAAPVAQTSRLRQLIMSVEGKFIRISEFFFDLLQRVNLVYFRSTSIESNSILLPLILSRSRKRKYPTYQVTRTLDIFPTREHLLAYERALVVEQEIDEAIREGSTQTERAEKAYNIFLGVYHRWKMLVTELKSHSDEECYARPGLERFEEGHVLTRVMYKGSEALGYQHKWDEQANLIRELLSQKRWRKGKRGFWYDRLALVLMAHLSKPREARDVILQGLNDEFTHIVARPQLIRRLRRLEKRLDIDEADCYVSERVLKQSDACAIEGIRVHERNASRSPSVASYLSNRGSVPPGRPALTSGGSNDKPLRGTSGHHSVWASKDGSGIGVEELVLEHFAKLGFHGFHSEGRIIRHIYLLLFWSILFQAVPGAFETAYQIAPLDLGHDSFFHSRRSEIEQRLREIKDGAAPIIAAAVDDRERPLNTFAIGAKWDLFTKDDTIQIIECLGGSALAVICRAISEDYVQRASGVPDLIIFNAAQRKARFVEVKGPGDSLMEMQKVWIDLLLTSGVDVQLCHVVEKGQIVKKKESKKRAKTVQSNVKSKGSRRSVSVRSLNDDQGATELCRNVDVTPRSEPSAEVITVYDSDAETEAKISVEPRKRTISSPVRPMAKHFRS